MNTTKHGHLLGASDIQQVQPGMTQEQVRLALGSPNTSSPLGNNAYYYISTTREQRAFVGSVVTDRQVVAVYFDNFGTVDRVSNYTLKDGKVIDLASDRTSPARGDENFLQQFFRGIGASKAAGAPGTQGGAL
ncbi:MAG: outer membrane protein assembly factor BamE [Pseudomonadota bacterium]